MLEVLLVEDNAGDALLIRRVLNENPRPIRLSLRILQAAVFP